MLNSKKVAAPKAAKKAVAKKAAPKKVVAKKVVAKKVVAKDTRTPEQRRTEGFAKQSATLITTMALTDKDWVRGLVCVEGEFKGQVIKNPRQGWIPAGPGWFTRSQKTALARKLFAAQKAGNFPIHAIGKNKFQLVMGLSVNARKALKQVGSW